MDTALTVLAGLSALIWLYLLFARDGFWRGRERLSGDAEPKDWPCVVAIVPARNEAETIKACLTSLAEQDYPGDFRIVMVDDASTDATAEIARNVAANGERPIEIVSGAPLEPGWTGKLWALNQGVTAAGDAEFLWFTDADITHGKGVLRALAAKAETDKRDIVSLMVRLHCATFWEAVLIPAFIFFFQKLYPFAAVNDPTRRTAGAAGGCLLIRRRALEAAGGIEAVHDRLIDDCALADAVKRSGGHIWLGLADDSRSIRPYTRLGEIWDMVARTAFTQLGYSWIKLVGTVIGMILVYLVPPLTTLLEPFHVNLAATLLAIVAWGLMALAYGPTLRYYGHSAVEGFITLPLAAVLYTAMTITSALRHRRGQGGKWKDRHYHPAERKS